MAGGEHPLIDQIMATPEGDSVEYDNFRYRMAERLVEADLNPDDYDMRTLWLFRDFGERGSDVDDFRALAVELLAELSVCGDHNYAGQLAGLAFQAEYTLDLYVKEIESGLAPTDDDEPLIDEADIFGHIHELAVLMFDLD